ncbi:MAG: hypothetical protein HND57_03110 [Planctomycetes bacterium]|nr:hypothetical protein [Planctomycetota bacterium]
MAAGRNLAAIGALNYNETGLVFLYNYSKQNGWTAGEVLTGSDTQSADMFGSSLDLSGTTLVVGAPGHDGNASSSGAAYVFEWTEGAGWNETAKLEPSDLLTNSLFGTSVAVSCEAVAVGSDQHHGLDERQGCVYVFGRDADGKWIQQDKLYAPNGRIGDYFGDSISLDGKQLLVGAPYTRDDPEPGFAYMWLPSHSDGWELLQMLSASGVSSGDKFGADVAVHDSTAVVGAPYDDENGQLAGAAYLFYLEDGGWGERAKLLPFDAMSGDWTGARISIHRGTAITNANRHNGEKGAVFAFHDLAPLSLDIEGDCPGKMRITIYGAKPDDRLALLYGTKQGKTEALPYCPDLFVNIANPIVAAVGRADGMGQLTVTGKVPGKACGRLIVQGVDLTTCEKTKATLLE